MLQALQPKRHAKQKEFPVEMMKQISENKTFLKRVIFSDEATFHVSGKLNKHNMRIWGYKQPHVIRELQRDSHINKPGYTICLSFCRLVILWGFIKTHSLNL